MLGAPVAKKPGDQLESEMRDAQLARTLAVWHVQGAINNQPKMGTFFVLGVFNKEGLKITGGETRSRFHSRKTGDRFEGAQDCISWRPQST